MYVNHYNDTLQQINTSNLPACVYTDVLAVRDVSECVYMRNTNLILVQQDIYDYGLLPVYQQAKQKTKKLQQLVAQGLCTLDSMRDDYEHYLIYLHYFHGSMQSWPAVYHAGRYLGVDIETYQASCMYQDACADGKLQHQILYEECKHEELYGLLDLIEGSKDFLNVTTARAILQELHEACPPQARPWWNWTATFLKK